MSNALEVDLNRAEPHSIDVGGTEFETDGSFDVVLKNRGSSLHVHLRLDDDLSQAAKLETANHYVEQDGVHRVRVTVDPNRLPVRGSLEIVTGYGAESERATISITDRQLAEDMPVDEDLSRPRPQPVEDTQSVDPALLPVVVLGVVALVIAILAVIYLEGTAVVLGSIIVVLGLVIAAMLYRR